MAIREFAGVSKREIDALKSGQSLESVFGAPKWGPIGREVYESKYSRLKQDGSHETWGETVKRVVDGNCSLVDEKYILPNEREILYSLIYNFKIIPAGRHLWVSGVPGRNFLFNCHNSSWGNKLSEHFSFSFSELMKGGGVGTNYSNSLISKYGEVKNKPEVHIVCDPSHQDYEKLQSMSLLSSKYSYKWNGAIRIEDCREGWVSALEDLIDYAMGDRDPQKEEREILGNDLVFDVSLVRHSGSRIKGFGGKASGPWALAYMLIGVAKIFARSHTKKLSSLDLMEIDHMIASCVIAGNVRRSARMSMKHWEDKDIKDFIKCKVNSNNHWTTNISLIIDDKFISQVKRKNTKARKILEEACRSMLLRSEPGFWNYSLSQIGEPSEVEVTNPCGEIALCPWENCNLGHVNLEAFIENDKEAKEAFRYMARFLIRATYGNIEDPKQQEVVKRNRRIGVGFFGFHGWLVKQGIKFSDSHSAHHNVGERLAEFRKAVEEAARSYAFQLRIPEPVKKTTIAPTGTIAKMPGSSEGAHPIFAPYFLRRNRYAVGDKEIENAKKRNLFIEKDKNSHNTMVVTYVCKDRLTKELEEMGIDPTTILEGATEIHLEDHLAVQSMIQRYYADNAVSYTVNVKQPECIKTVKHDNGSYFSKVIDEEEFEKEVKKLVGVFIRKLPHLKGTTIMVQGSYEQAPYEEITKQQYEEMSQNFEENVSMVDVECKHGCPIR